MRDAIVRSLLDLVYPRVCTACGVRIRDEPGHVCWDCRTAFQIVVPPFCKCCGDPVDGQVEHEYTCFACERKAPHFDLARSAARYRGPLREVLQRFKYSQGTHVEPDLVPLLKGCADTHLPVRDVDAVTFVPLYPARERDRTYNQSRLLAAGLARGLRKPLTARCLKRIRPTSTQTTLTATERAENMRGAFASMNESWIEGRRFLLVDDVMTMTATQP